MNNRFSYSQLKEAACFVRKNLSDIPQTVLVLGSGLGDFADSLTEKEVIPYSDIPFFPQPTVQGHSGSLIYGKLGEVSILMMQGRVHFYEGYSIDEVVFPIRLFVLLGIKNLILTNAAGGISSILSEGSLMLIDDHISLFCQNPLIGANEDRFGCRFPDMHNIYDPQFRSQLLEISKEEEIPLPSGVYGYATGPSYETPAEIRLFSSLGADAIGMSTVPEAIVAHHGGIKIAAISCITNMAAGLSNKSLNHAEVIEVANKVKGNFQRLLFLFIQKLGNI